VFAYQVHLMKELAELDNYDHVIGHLKGIADHVLRSSNLRYL